NSAFSSGGASNINSVIDKVGLYRAYTNGEDQASYLANNTNANPDALHSDRQSREWFASAGTTTGDVDFDLGGVFSIANVVLWNEDVFGIKEFDILAGNNADLSDLTYVNSFIAADQAVSPLNVPSFVEQAQVFDLGSTISARYIRLLIGSAYPYEAPNRDNVADPGFRSASIGEVAFGVVDPIPTPSDTARFDWFWA
ncbi:MAG: hypothetical protein HC808_20305, partial [Candidatus Competibacteraceae bacterium]|nr:hypothetical protein [Candidatus Competibacteraceae bacterium]